MAAAADVDFYAVLGLKKECSSTELRHAYKKLALKWHPDRFSASGSPKNVDEAKKKFQTIQQAYSVFLMNKKSFRSLVILWIPFTALMVVLSDTNKRFLYDVGVYDCNDDEDNNGMGEFLNEMATMMSQTKPEECGNETFEELQELFDDLFQSDTEAFSSSSRSATSSSSVSGNEGYSASNKRNSTEMRSGSLRGEASHYDGFCMGPGGESSRRKNTRKVQR